MNTNNKVKVTIKFVGRLSGAIGVVYPITAKYEVNSIEELKTKFHLDFECFRDVKITSSVGWTFEQLQKADFLKVNNNK